MRCSAIAVILLLTALTARADDVPTMQALRDMEARSDWSGLVQGTARAIKLKDPEPAYDRGELYRLKSEAHVHLKQFSVAADTLQAAAREPKMPIESADRFAALAMLFRASDARGYKPAATRENPKPAYHDVLAPASRDAAMKVLCDVELRGLNSLVSVLGDRTQLSKYRELCERALELRPLERTATGRSQQTDAALAETQQRFADRALLWLEATRQGVEAIAKAANEVVTERGKERRRGLRGQDQMDLAAAQDGCQKWLAAQRNLAAAIGETCDPGSTNLRGPLQELDKRARDVLTDKYGKVSPRDSDARR